ncbi:hypothetical protein MW887_000134 [Aspergillus wentii]|nr:hypothetical protein MW887_000134 [Aspergillus wentii]
MAEHFTLDPAFYDIAREKWVVKLKFIQQGQLNFGTGFFINLPDVNFHVILTAGHNLIDSKGNPSEGLRIEQLPGDQPQPNMQDLRTHVCPEYQNFPDSANLENDYGIILVPKANDVPSRGFGFAVKLGHVDLQNASLEMCGYRAGSEPGNLDTSNGKCKGSGNGRLTYEITTEKGLSGSPVFMPYKGHETVVAIHNNAPRKEGTGSRGARLNTRVLQQIFKWTGSVYENQSLRVCDNEAPPEGWVRLGKEGLDTTFDIFPAYAPTPNVNNNPLYVFRHRSPPGWPQSSKERWVLWDVVQKSVRLTNHLQEFCFPRIVRDKKNEGGVRIVMTTLGGRMSNLMEFRMNCEEIAEEDKEMGHLDTPEISIERHFGNKQARFNSFRFEKGEGGT